MVQERLRGWGAVSDRDMVRRKERSKFGRHERTSWPWGHAGKGVGTQRPGYCVYGGV